MVVSEDGDVASAWFINVLYLLAYITSGKVPHLTNV